MLDLASLKKAISSLKEALECYYMEPSGVPEDILRDSVIQRFVYTYELAWKLMKRWLEINIGSTYVDGISRRELFRLATESQLISNPKKWFSFHAARNQTSHIYDLAIACDVFKEAVAFAEAVDAFYLELDKRND